MSLLTRLDGAELAQVWFVRDYVQLIFEDPAGSWSLQCWVWPRVRVGGQEIAPGEARYRDSLCELIGQQVVSTGTARGLRVDFVGAGLVVDPSIDELVGPEIAMLHPLFEQAPGMVWRPGEGAFEHLA